MKLHLKGAHRGIAKLQDPGHPNYATWQKTAQENGEKSPYCLAIARKRLEYGGNEFDT